MRKLSAAISIATLSLTSLSALAANAPMTNNQQLSYALGYQIGQGFVLTQTNINDQGFVQGFNDGIRSKTPVVPQKKARQLIRQFEQSMQTKAVYLRKAAEKKLAAQKAAAAKRSDQVDNLPVPQQSKKNSSLNNQAS